LFELRSGLPIFSAAAAADSDAAADDDDGDDVVTVASVADAVHWPLHSKEGDCCCASVMTRTSSDFNDLSNREGGEGGKDVGIKGRKVEGLSVSAGARIDCSITVPLSQSQKSNKRSQRRENPLDLRVDSL